MLQNYKEWFSDKWQEHGGLITQAQAAKILNKTSTRIRQMIKEKKLTLIKYNNDAPILSYAEIMKIYKTKEHKETNTKQP